MSQPKLFDIIKLRVNLPEVDRRIGNRGTIVECYGDEAFEVEFINESGETVGLATLSRHQFVVVWQAATQQWVRPRGDYDQLKDQLFAGETVDSLYEKIQAQENAD
ncbi:MAG: DUF4926 domain-containing protein [Leptolyngbya sp. SIO4C5]|nr:DUF4926 domain-containing protein [Leptolyngbya sp. SIO4C5]